MSYFKNNPDFNLFYSDTDAAYIDRALPDYMVSNTILGKIKLEKICSKVIFLAPKVYGLLDINNNLTIKVKGLSQGVINTLTLLDLEQLLVKDTSKTFNQDKWFRNIVKGNITIKDQLYSLQVTGNKRKLIYNENNKLIDSKPFVINENKEIIN